VTARDVLFAVLAVISAGAAIAAVTTRQLVHAALWLVTTLGALAGCYLVLGAEVVALVQVLVYVGAVVVLVIFALMLTRAPIGRSADLNQGLAAQGWAAAAGLATTGLLLGVFGAAVRWLAIDVRPGTTQQLASRLFGTWALPFELLSLLLLGALVAALVVSAKDLQAPR
jgi:NADH-quinone oxidoreductase subunit J